VPEGRAGGLPPRVDRSPSKAMDQIDADVVVIGSGATGGWAAKSLTEAGRTVVLLEAGPAARAEDCPHDWYTPGKPWRRAAVSGRNAVQSRHPAHCLENSHLWADDSDHPYTTPPDEPFVWIRARIEGGRSNLWGGQCWRLTEDEFGASDQDGFGIRWPLAYQDLEADYADVERFQDICGRADGAKEFPDQVVNGEVNLTAAEEHFIGEIARRYGRTALPVRAASPASQAYRDAGAWPRFSSLGSTLPAALQTGRLRIIHDAVVSRLEVDRSGNHVRRADYIDAISGQERSVRARAFVLCASTVESTRILLNSSGPRHRAGLGNRSGTLGRFLMDHNVTLAIGATGGQGGPPGTVFGGRGGVYMPGFEQARGGRDFLRGYGVWCVLGRPVGEGVDVLLTAVGEMLPYADNTVTLDRQQVDRFGLAVPRIRCVARANERRMRAHQRDTLRELAHLAGVRLADEPAAVAVGAMVHEVGTARMGADPANSFCNAYAQSWEVPNVFIPDGACWTTSAYQNPTLTMMAIARRACMHLNHWLDKTH
jgi:choline dehydrogenase-like flavoprotein